MRKVLLKLLLTILVFDQVFSQALRLVGGSSNKEGRLEIQYNGTWGTVCDDGFEDVDASVACYQLGFGYSGLSVDNSHGPGSGTIWLDDVRCTATETSLSECGHSGWGQHNCDDDEDVSIQCDVWPLRLVDGSSNDEGRLEIQYNGTWGTVCDDRFDKVDASVACYQMFETGGIVIDNRYGPGSGPIWLDDVQCTGTETSLSHCQHNGWGRHDCDHDKDVSIECNEPEDDGDGEGPPTGILVAVCIIVSIIIIIFGVQFYNRWKFKCRTISIEESSHVDSNVHRVNVADDGVTNSGYNTHQNDTAAADVIRGPPTYDELNIYAADTETPCTPPPSYSEVAVNYPAASNRTDL